MGNKLVVYLAGGMRGFDWRDIFTSNADLQGIEFTDPRSWGEECPNEYEYTRRDLLAVDTCDVVVALMEPGNPSGMGMAVEVGYAAAQGKPVIHVDLMNPADFRYRSFGMVRAIAADLCVGSIDHAIIELKRLNCMHQNGNPLVSLFKVRDVSFDSGTMAIAETE